MALIKYGTTIGNADAQHNATFDKKHKPGEAVELSGIYRCAGCGDEYALNKGTVFPPQNQHQHPNPGPGKQPTPIEWQLLVYAVTK